MSWIIYLKIQVTVLTNVLVVGSGGREHALSWKLSQSDSVDTVYTAPGNGGTQHNVHIQVSDLEGLASFARDNDCFTVVGPEAPLADGMVDKFGQMDLRIFGPTSDAARLESSKIWAKNFMQQNNIPTAKFGVFEDASEALDYAKSFDYKVAIKADGLAAGKGVIVCDGPGQAISAVDTILTKKAFGEAGSRIIVEEKIDGTEVSYIALCDGNMAVPMATSQDHKRIFDGDVGPNTGGMGAYSPATAIDESLTKKIQKDIVDKTVHTMKSSGMPFVGFLYAGIIIRDGQPYVLEYNVRMGDPECQPITLRMDFDLFEYLNACVDGKLSDMPMPSWKNQSAVCVVLASKGYPGSYPKNDEILGLDDVPVGSIAFHAGTRSHEGAILSNGGRVMGVTSLGDTLESAISNAYECAGKISWPNKYCRRDIGRRGLSGQ